MALSRRSFLVELPVCTATVLGCSPAERQHTDAASGSLLFSRRARNPNARAIVVFMPETRPTREVWQGLADELGDEYDLIAVRAETKNTAPIIARGIERYRPAGLVLMNNPTVDGYREYQEGNAAKRFPPAVIVMSSFLEGKPQRLSGATGISYEVPLITVVTNLRKLIASPIDRIGVIHRASLNGFVERQASLAFREQTRVLREQVSHTPNASEIKRALRRLKERCDALWVLNDDRLLTPRLIADGWLPGLNEAPWRPAIVGAASLVSPTQSFGTFAVLPDHTALGAQAASLILDIAEREWTLPEKEEAELPLSTTTTVDLAQVKERFSLRPDALARVDRVLDR